MRDAILTFMVGVVLGVGGGYVAFVPGKRVNPVIDTPAPLAISCDSEVQRYKTRVAELEARVSTPVAVVAASATQAEMAREEGVGDGGVSPAEAKREVIGWRVSAIEKFVPVTAEQKTRLTEKFEEEQRSKEEDRAPSSESLDDILGAENAKYYREQVRAAFERVQNEELQKEVVWLSRQLGLNADQERAVQDSFDRVEERVDQEFGSSQHGESRSAQDRVKLMIAENKRRNELRAEELKNVLPPDQYQAYLRSQADSASSDVEVFHDPGK